MPFREPPPSPAALRLTRRAAVADMAHSGLLAGSLLGPPASVGQRHVTADVLEAISRPRGPIGFGGPAALAEAVSRPLLPSTAAEINAMLDEAREQLAERDRQREPRDIVDESGTAYPPPVSPPWMPPSRDRLQHHLDNPCVVDPRVNCTCGRRLGACTCETVWQMPELQHGWTTAPDGTVSTPAGLTVFTLPPNYRPSVAPEAAAAVDMCIGMLNP